MRHKEEEPHEEKKSIEQEHQQHKQTGDTNDQ